MRECVHIFTITAKFENTNWNQPNSCVDLSSFSEVFLRGENMNDTAWMELQCSRKVINHGHCWIKSSESFASLQP